MSFRILTDTSANLPTALLREKQIDALPLVYIEDGVEKACTDTNAFDDLLYYNNMRAGRRVSTSMINQDAFEQAMEERAAAGEDLLYVGISSGVSGTIGAATAAAQAVRARHPERQIEVFDTLGASLGEGLLALAAAQMRAAGDCLNDVIDSLRILRSRMRQVFMVDDLMHLRRSGRVSHLSAIIGSMLSIKPLLCSDEAGKIVVWSKCRGRAAAVRALAEQLFTHITDALSQTVGIAYAGCRDEAEKLAALLREKFAGLKVLSVAYEPVTGAHVGPGALALFFMGAPDERRR